MSTLVWCKTTFEGFHRWPDAPPEVEFLRARHRHLFHVTAAVTVQGHDREVEFITLKRNVDQTIQNILGDEETETWSCEQWAKTLLVRMHLAQCSVSEDDENGATVFSDKIR